MLRGLFLLSAVSSVAVVSARELIGVAFSA